jgi:hypothetical protein
MGLQEDVKNYIECPWSDGYTSMKIIEKYGENAFQKEMKRQNGWNKHHRVVDDWMRPNKRGSHGRY